MVDATGVIMCANALAAGLLNVPVGELRGLDLAGFVAESYSRDFSAVVDAASRGEVLTWTMPITATSAAPVDVTVRATAIGADPNRQLALVLTPNLDATLGRPIAKSGAMTKSRI